MHNKRPGDTKNEGREKLDNVSVYDSQGPGGGEPGGGSGGAGNDHPEDVFGRPMFVQLRPAKNKACSVQPATSFVQTYKADAAILAQLMQGVPTNFVLAMAGNESAYGKSAAATGANNYFGLHAGAPGSTPWSTNPILAAFPAGNGFLLSGQSFVRIATPLLSRVTNPSNEISFFTAMHAKWGVGHTLQYYLNVMTGPKGVANMTAIRMNCP